MQKLSRSLIALGGLAALAACGDDVSIAAPTPTPVAVVGVTVSPQTLTLKVGEKATLGVSVETTGGAATTVTWSSSTPTVASVSATGEVTAVTAGNTTVRAVSTVDGSKSGAAQVTVQANAVRSVTVSPQSLTLQIGQTATPVATVDRDAGVAGSVNWASNNEAVATVNATSGLITAVTAGTAIITATSTVDNTKSAALAVTVTAVPNNLTALSVAPTTANLGIGGTLQLVPSATTVGTPTVTYSYQSSNELVATVSTTGLVTAVGNGTAVVTTTATTNTNSLSVATTINVASASVSISSITTGATNVPVNIANVFGQIEVTMNIASGNQQLDSVRVKLGNKVAAQQNFTVNGAPNAPVTLSINTAAYTVNADSTASVTFLNGSTGVQAELFVRSASGPTASNTITINLNNSDTFHARWSLPSNSATSAAGLLWYGGPNTSTTVNVIPVMYSGNIINSATIHMDDASVDGNASLCGAAVTDATAPVFTATFACTGLTNVNVQPGVAASLRADGNAGPAAVVAIDPAGAPVGTLFANAALMVQNAQVPVRIDVLGPATATYAFVAPTTNDYWANAAFRHDTSTAGVFSRARAADAGVGANVASTDLYQYEDRAVAGTSWTDHNANTTDIPENPVDFTVNAYNGRVTEFDLLGNSTVTYLGSTTATPGTQNFGVDVTAPTLDYLTATQNPLIVRATLDTLDLTKILNNADPVTANLVTAANGVFGVRHRDTRSGFDTTQVGVQSGLFRRITRLAPAGVTCALGGTSCAFRRDSAGYIDLSDPTYRRDTTLVYGTYVPAVDSDSTGYYTYEAYVVDRAGNVSPTITKTIAVDIQAPQITGLGIPAVLTGGSTVAFTPTGTDDLEVIDGSLTLRYPSMGGTAVGDSLLHFPRTFFADIKTPFSGAPLANVIGLSGQFGQNGLTLPFGFIRTLAVVDPDSSGPTLAASVKPNSVGAQLNDIKSTSTGFAQPIGTTAANADTSVTVFVNILAGLITGPTANPWVATLGDTLPATNVSGPGAIWSIFGSGTTGSAIQARARTGTVVTNVPFPQVAFFRQEAATGRWIYLGKVDAVAGVNPTIFDSGSNRFWTYTFSGVTPAVAAADVIRAVGINTSGDALSTLSCVKGAGC